MARSRRTALSAARVNSYPFTAKIVPARPGSLRAWLASLPGEVQNRIAAPS